MRAIYRHVAIAGGFGEFRRPACVVAFYLVESCSAVLLRPLTMIEKDESSYLAIAFDP